MSIVRFLFSSGMGVMKDTKTALHDSHFHLDSLTRGRSLRSLILEVCCLSVSQDHVEGVKH